jgi:hypothetical protein
MRKIDISTEVFAKIWSLRIEGEETENEILQRILVGADEDATEVEGAIGPVGEDGVYDRRHGIHFPRGMRIWWRYKRRDFYAVAEKGCWRRRDNNERFLSLNALTQSIADAPQNAWAAWRFEDAEGRSRLLHELRHRVFQTRYGPVGNSAR